MFRRQTSGSVVCTSCGSLVGVNDPTCYNCGRRNPGLWGYGPALRRLGQDLGFVSLVIYGCAGLYLAMLALTLMMGQDIMGGGLMGLLSPSTSVMIAFGASGAYPVAQLGMWWTVLSAGWLHASALHILFNMLWVKQLGPATSEVYGAGRMIIIYTVSGVTGFLLSSLAGMVLGGARIPFIGAGLLTVGASAPIFGLLGALVYYGRRGGSSMIGTQAKQYALILFLFGLFMGGIDNYAHAGGFLGGYAAGIWLDPLKPERIDHLAIAVGCVAATALSIVASLVTVLPQIIR
jgi:membrane associated rhomboid family serine protease